MKSECVPRQLGRMLALLAAGSLATAVAKADEPPAGPGQMWQRVLEAIETSDLSPEMRDRIIERIRPRLLEPRDQPGELSRDQQARAREDRWEPSGREFSGARERGRELVENARERGREFEWGRALESAREREERERDDRDSGQFQLGLMVEQRADGGLGVAEVSPGSPAAAAGFRRGDVIRRVGDQPVQTRDQLLAHVREAGRQARPLEVFVHRGDQDLVIAVTPAAAADREDLRRGRAPEMPRGPMGPDMGPGLGRGPGPDMGPGMGMGMGPGMGMGMGPGMGMGMGMGPGMHRGPEGPPWSAEIEGLRREVEDLRRQLDELRRSVRPESSPAGGRQRAEGDRSGRMRPGPGRRGGPPTSPPGWMGPGWAPSMGGFGPGWTPPREMPPDSVGPGPGRRGPDSVRPEAGRRGPERDTPERGDAREELPRTERGGDREPQTGRAEPERARGEQPRGRQREEGRPATVPRQQERLERDPPRGDQPRDAPTRDEPSRGDRPERERPRGEGPAE